MSERGVCICPACGCQFSDDQKAKYERMALRLDWRRRPFYRFRVWRLSRRLKHAAAFDDAGHPDAPALSNRQPDETVPDGAQSAAPPSREETP